MMVATLMMGYSVLLFLKLTICIVQRVCNFHYIEYFSSTERLREVDQFMMNCELSRMMQDLIGNYIMMEEYFMREMFLKVSLLGDFPYP